MEMRIFLGFACLVFVFTSCQTSIQEEHHPDGSIKLRAEMTNGQRDGLTLEFSPEGNVISRGEWRNGVPHGTTIEYFNNGQVKNISTWVNGKEHGESMKYTEDGYLYSVGTYRNSKKKLVKIYHKNGKVLERQLYNRDERIIYVSRYDSLGLKEYSMVPPIFESNEDTILLGETYHVKISFGIPLSGRLEVLIGPLGSPVSLSDTTARLESTEKIFTYSIKPDRTGRITIPFLFNHKPAEGDSINIDGMLSKHNFYVVDKSLQI